MVKSELKYRDIMDLGFKEMICEDRVYFDQFGFEYAIITLHLTSLIYLDWSKDTRECDIVRIDNIKNKNIKARLKIESLQELKDIVEFSNHDKYHCLTK